MSTEDVVVAAATTEMFDTITSTRPPSHILQDGTFVYLPLPSTRERIQFFERSIARHGLLQEDLRSKEPQTTQDDDDDNNKKNNNTCDTEKIGSFGARNDEKSDTTEDDTKPKIHPLALASAGLQSNGINELNRAINLYSLVAGGEYLGLTTIVDPSMEQQLAANDGDKTSDSNVTEKSTTTPNTTTTATSTTTNTTYDILDLESQHTKANYVLKRKRIQYEQAGYSLQQHRQRLIAAVAMQSVMDARWRTMRLQWRLAAPEHGTKAVPHAVRPTRVVTVDGDVYNTTTTTTTTTASVHGNNSKVAQKIPRYATLEWKEETNIATTQNIISAWKVRHGLIPQKKSLESTDDAMEIDNSIERLQQEQDSNGRNDSKTDATIDPSTHTRAEPFMIPDPSLGKVDADFDPSKVAMLTLQFDIEKPSTGFCQSACLEPIAASQSSKDDETMLAALQHSLFCAKLFASIRRELAPDTQEVGQIRFTGTTSRAAVWLSVGDAGEENFLPPPSFMIQGDPDAIRDNYDGGVGLEPLCVVHIHEGDVKVLLDREYALRVRLVEASCSEALAVSSHQNNNDHQNNSGSQSPEVLLTVCRALLLHAQEEHHGFSVQNEVRNQAQQREDAAKLADLQKHNPSIRELPPNRRNNNNDDASPRILQSCVSLGTKLLFERRIRKTLKSVNKWIKIQPGVPLDDPGLVIDFLALSLFDLHAQFTVSWGNVWYMDANIVGDELTITRFEDSGEYRKAKFHTEQELEIYLKTVFRKLLKKQASMDQCIPTLHTNINCT